MNNDLKNFFIKNPNHKFEVVLLTYFGRSGSFLLQSCLDKNPNILNLYPLLDRSFYIIAEKARDIPLNSFYDFFIKNFDLFERTDPIREIFRADNQSSFKLSDKEKKLLFDNIQKILTEIDKKKIIYNKIQFYFNLLYVSFAQIINFKVEHNNLKLIFHPHHNITDKKFSNCIKNLGIRNHLATIRLLPDNFISYRRSSFYRILEAEKRVYFAGLDKDDIQKYCCFSFTLNLFARQIPLLNLIKERKFIRIEDIHDQSIFEILPEILSIKDKNFNYETMSFAGQAAIWKDYYQKEFVLSAYNSFKKRNKRKTQHLCLFEKIYIHFLFSDLNSFFYPKKKFNKIFEKIFLVNFIIFKFIKLNIKYSLNKISIKENMIKTIYCIKDDLKAILNYKRISREFLINEKKYY